MGTMKSKPALLFSSLVLSIAFIGCTGLQSSQKSNSSPAPSGGGAGGSGESPHSTFVYVANNGSGNIAEFKMAENGSLAFVGLTSAGCPLAGQYRQPLHCCC